MRIQHPKENQWCWGICVPENFRSHRCQACLDTGSGHFVSICDVGPPWKWQTLIFWFCKVCCNTECRPTKSCKHTNNACGHYLFILDQKNLLLYFGVSSGYFTIWQYEKERKNFFNISNLNHPKMPRLLEQDQVTKLRTKTKPVNRLDKPSVAHTLLKRYHVTEGDGVPWEERCARAPAITQQQHHPKEKVKRLKMH